jgi:uncharacterized protein (DUF4415 family)
MSFGLPCAPGISTHARGSVHSVPLGRGGVGEKPLQGFAPTAATPTTDSAWHLTKVSMAVQLIVPLRHILTSLNLQLPVFCLYYQVEQECVLRKHGVSFEDAMHVLEDSETAMSKLVRKTIAESPMTPVRKRKLAQVAARPDSEIDFSEIPPLKASFWKNAVRNPFYRPVKQQLTVRLDADVVTWLRQQGKGYQTRLNQVLREAMLEDIKKSA